MIVINLDNLMPAMVDVIHSGLFDLLVILIVLDVFTGCCKARKLNIFSSRIGNEGLKKHLGNLVSVFIVAVVTRLIDGYAGWGQKTVRFSWIWCLYYILNYLASILDNYEILEWYVPPFARPLFEKISSYINEQVHFITDENYLEKEVREAKQIKRQKEVKKDEDEG